MSCYGFNMNIMQYFGKFSPCTRYSVHAQRVLKYNFILIYDLTIIENIFVDKGQMMLKKIAKIKNFNNFMLRHLVDFKYGI